MSSLNISVAGLSVNDSLVSFLESSAMHVDKGISFIRSANEEEFLSYAGLYDMACSALFQLEQAGMEPGDELLIQTEDNKTLLVLLWACMIGKIIPVPLGAGKVDDHRLKVFRVYEAMNNGHYSADEKLFKNLEIFAEENGLNDQFRVIKERFIPVGYIFENAGTGKRQDVHLYDPGYIQFSSGSTGAPKGVHLTHHNLLTNCIDILKRSETTSDDVFLSWMPLTHDMGLICFHFCAVVACAQQYIIPTDLFVRRPLLWFEKASEHKATQLYSPNFGYHYLMNAMEGLGQQSWDLSAVRIIYNGAEPISFSLCCQFSKMMSVYGLKDNAIFPGYGLAEASVAVSLPTVGDTIKEYKLARNSLNIGDAIQQLVDDDEQSVSFVETGHPIEHCRIRICDDNNQQLGEDTIGHIQLSGGNITKGYYNNEKATSQVMTVDGWLRTGDLGFMHEGRLVITGRAKNLIIINGQNYYPQDIERIIHGSLPEFSTGKAVACSVKNSMGVEELVVFLLFKGELKDFVSNVRTVKDAVIRQIGLTVAQVLPLKRIPKTTSGKIQYYKLSEEFEKGLYNETIEAINTLLSADEKLFTNGSSIEEKLRLICETVTGSTQANLIEHGLNSITATRIASRIRQHFSVNISLQDIFDHPSLDSLSAFIKKASTIENLPVDPIEEQEYYNASKAQKRFWILQQLDESQVAYNLSNTITIKGKFNLAVFDKAVNLLIKRYEILRTSFLLIDGEVKQKIQEPEAVNCNTIVEDLTATAEPDVSARKRIQQLQSTPFDLGNAPLFRFHLLKTGTDHCYLSFNIHHIITDGWSVGLLIEQINALYHLQLQNIQPFYEPLPLQFKDFAARQQLQLESERMQHHKRYWQQELQGELPVVELPISKPRKPLQTFHGGAVELSLGGCFSRRLEVFCSDRGLTMFTALVSSVAVLLHRYTAQDDIIIGTDSAGRIHPESEEQMGYFLNTIPLMISIQGSDDFNSVLSKTKQKLAMAMENQEYPFDCMVEDLGLKRDKSRTPIFDVLVLFQNLERSFSFSKLVDDAVITEIKTAVRTSIVDLEFEFIYKQNILCCDIKYNADLFERVQIERLATHFRLLMTTAIQDPSIAVESYTMMPEDEVQKLQQFSSGSLRIDSVENCIDRFERQVILNPSGTALSFEEISFTYEQLNAEVNRLANYLTENGHVKIRDRVGLLMQRSHYMIISLLAVLKTGASYIPIDPEYPAERINYICTNSDLNLLISDDHTLEEHQPVAKSTLSIDAVIPLLHEYSTDNSPYTTLPSDKAYILYTSGTTGKPKGVIITHKSLTDYIVTFQQYFKLGPEDVVIQQSSLSFDVSVEEIFPILCAGGTLVISRDGARDVQGLLQLIESKKATLLSTTPFVISELNAYPEKLSTLRILISGGDVLKPSFIDKLYNKIALYNTYGPTETTVCVTYHRIRRLSDVNIIGKPLPNHSIYILDEQMRPVPLGVPGEICISGNGLAFGYLNLTAETKRAFVPNPFQPGSWLYKTGDTGLWLENGNIRFLGRKDTQFKWRGYRIEPIEIEKAITEYTDVKHALAIVKTKESDAMLVAYFTADAIIDIADLRLFIAQRLPYYMIPSRLVQIKEFAQSENGKIDVKALPDPFELSIQEESSGETTAMETSMLRLWRELLENETIEVTDNFFVKGGHSIKATRMLMRIEQEYGVRLNIRDVFLYPTPRQLCSLIESAKAAVMDHIPTAGLLPYYPVSLGQQRLWVLHHFNKEQVGYNLSWSFKIEGVELSVLREAFKILVQRHESLRTSFILKNDLPVQLIHDYSDEYFSFSCETVSTETIDLVRLRSHACIPFDLEKAPLFRIRVYSFNDRLHTIGFTIHHIVADGWSMEVLSAELYELLNALPEKRAPQLPALRIQQKDFAIWQQQFFKSDAIATHRQYWLDKFSDGIPVVELPGAKQRPLVLPENGSTVRVTLPVQLMQNLQQLGGTANASLFMCLVALLKALFFKYTGQQDIVIGTPASGRQHADLENQIGYYLNLLALRTGFDKDGNFMDLLDRVKRTIVEAYEHQDYPVDKLAGMLPLPGNTNRLPFFDVLVVLQDFENRAIQAPSLQGNIRIHDVEEIDTDTSIGDLLFEFNKLKADWTFKIRFNTYLYDLKQIERLANHFITLATAVVADARQPLYTYSILNNDEYSQLLSFAEGDRRMPEENYVNVIKLFEQQVTLRPDAIAVRLHDRSFTYSEIEQKTNQLAFYLRHRYEAGKGQIIGVYMPRTENAIITLLAIIKTGAAWLPLDPDYPEERIRFMMEDAGVTLVIGDHSLTGELFNGMQVVNLNEEALFAQEFPLIEWPEIEGDELAYVMYTSGSTGRPKGVLISHASLWDYIKTFAAYYQLSHNDRVVQQSSLSFDVCIEEIFPVLCCGGTLLLLPEGGRDIEKLVQVIKNEEATILSTTPLVINELNEQADRLQSLRVLISGGDELMPSYVNKLIGKLAVYNTYGPTETTVCASYHRIGALSDASIIGKPVYNKNIYILDEQLQPVPVGIPGEMYIAGAGLAMGYLNLADETSARFRNCPFGNGKMYRTGDMGSWKEDGSIQFLGRKDEQVKIRGYRVEPGEIENIINQHAFIKKAVVLTRKDAAGLMHLAAFFEERVSMDVAVLRHWIAARVPAYMVPEYLVAVSEFPLLSNGKIDRFALMQLPLHEGTYESAEPTTALQFKLSAIWKDILQKDRVGLHDNFFSLGGHSIKATRMVSVIANELKVEIGLQHIFQYPTIAALAEIIEQATAGSAIISSLDKKDCYEVSNAQKRLWILHQFKEEHAAYNITWGQRLKGELNEALLEQAFLQLIQRHESLRTCFNEVNETLKQFVIDAKDISFAIYYHDISVNTNSNEQLTEIVREEQSSIFDLTKAPLMRVRLIKQGYQHYVLVVNMHHIISDGWSVQVMVKDLISIYNASVKGNELYLPPLDFHYKDYATFIHNQYSNPSFNTHRQYWLKQLEQAPVLDLPADYLRPPIKTTRGRSCNYVIGEEVVDQLNRLVATEGVSVYMILLAALKLLCYRYTGQTDIVIGSPVSGREFAGLEKQVGFYVNTLAFRTRFEESDDLRTLLKRVKTTTVEAYAHQLFPFDMLVEELQLERDLSRSPLFDIMLTMHQGTSVETDISLDGVEISALPLESVTSKFDLNLNVFPSAREWKLVLEYNTDLFSRTRMEFFLTHFHNILKQFIQKPFEQIGSFEYISAEEKQTILQVFNNTTRTYDESCKTILDYINRQVSKQGGNEAVYFENTELTYEQLQQESNRLAHVLIEQCKVKPGDLVGLFMERSEKMIIALLAVLKTGAAYVPIDPQYPVSRVEYMIGDCNAKLIITEKKLAHLLNEQQPVYLVENFLEYKTARKEGIPEVNILPEHAAYIIYTSGSTGRPKGVVITHANLLAFVNWAMDEFRNDAFEIVYASTSYCFDLSIFELLFTLCAGKKIRLLQSGSEIGKYLQHHRQVLINTVPGVVENLIKEQQDLSSVVTLNMAGEPIPVSVKKKLDCNRIRVRNLYGPSEDTTYSTCYRFSQQDETISIGQPISNTRIYITDHYDNIVPIGIPGEICIAGDGLAKGYLNRPELTAEKFVTGILGEGRVYKTGDIGRWLYNGTIDFLGRKDNQVKIRGYRIETGEIETVLSAYPGIRKSLVVVKGNAADKLLVAYYTAHEKIADEQLAYYLRMLLPEYMVPNYFVWLLSFPLTPNGKIDRKQLPDPVDDDLNERILPRTVLEAQLFGIWKAVLERDDFGVRDNFFRLGGHSLKAVQILSRITKQLSIAIELRDVFAYSSIEKLALLLANRQHSTTEVFEQVEEQEYYAASPAQQRLWILNQLDGGHPVYNMPGAYVINGKLNVHALENAYRALIERHEILRTTFGLREEKLVQFIHTPAEINFNLKLEDMRMLAGTETVINDIMRTEIARPFNLEQAPLMRVRLLQLNEEQYYLVVVMHHIVSDGWSMEVIMQEILALYNAQTLAPLKFQYKDYAVARQHEIATPEFEVHRKYWLEHLSGELPVLDLPADKIRPAKKTYNGKMVRSLPDIHLTAKLHHFAEQTNSSVFTVLLAAFNALLYRYTQQEDIITGTAVAGRKQLELENQVGFYVNTLALRTAVNGANGFHALVDIVKSALMNAYEHQDYPFDLLVEELNIARDLSRSPLFDVMLLMQQSVLPNKHQSVPGIQYKELELPYETAKFDLTVLFRDDESGLIMQVQYNTDVFSQQWVERMMMHYISLLNCSLENANTALNKLDYLLPDEKLKLLHSFNNTNKLVPAEETIVSLFEQQVIKTPDAKAIIFQEDFLTYSQLNERADKLAVYLRHHFNIRPDDRIGLMIDRSTDLLVGILGILKAGAAYVPIDPAYPVQRIEYMIDDSGISLLLTDRLFDIGANTKLINIKEEAIASQKTESLPLQARASNLAYVIYTSGSTGQPKGAMIEHGSVVNLCYWLKEMIYDKYSLPLNVLLTASVSFDSSVKQLFPPLLWGSTLVLLSEEARKDPEALRTALIRYSIDVWDATPSYLSHFLSVAQGEMPAVRCTLAGGEPIKENLVSRYYELMGAGSRLINVYGVTEATVDSTCEIIEPRTSFTSSIGKPLPNTTIYILDRHRQLLPERVPGEICIAGKGVARGYLKREELTRQKFIDDPFHPGRKMYCTGDVGEWLPDGRISFKGRSDRQVKIRGYRIEPGEIEHFMQLQAGVKQCLVLTKKDRLGEEYLVAYIIGDAELSVVELKHNITELLPAYMVPSFIIQLKQFPLTAHGKIDQRALPEPDQFTEGLQRAYVGPRNSTETSIAGIFSNTLGVEQISVTDNFFELGGHSLKAILIAAGIQQQLNVPLSPSTLFQYPTVEKLAAYIDTLKPALFTTYEKVSTKDSDLEEITL